MKIVVTGANGFIGQEVVLQLLAEGHDVVGLDLRERPSTEPGRESNYSEFLFDLDDHDKLADLLLGERPEVVIALAEALKGPIAEVPATTASSTSALLAVCEKAGVRRVCIASSLTIYHSLQGPFVEEEGLPLTSFHPIAAIKKAQEVVAHWFDHQTPMEVVCMRLAHIYGPRYHTMWNSVSRYLMSAMGRLNDGLPPLDLAMYDALSDFCHVSDCARGIVLVASAAELKERVYNIASGQPSTDDRIKAAVALATGSSSAALPETENRNFLDITRISNELGYLPRYGIEDGVRQYREWALASF